MLIKDGIEFRNLVEQVQKNKEDIAKHYEIDRTLSNFGIKIVGTVATVNDLPNPLYYEGEYGDGYAVGQPGSYTYYLFTRPDPNAGITENHWLDVGQLAIQGPEGPVGPEGPQGPRGEATRWYTSSAEAANALPGDLWLDKHGGVYKKNTEENVWTPVANIKGPQGVQGPRGIQGEQGPQGPQGPQGDTGEAGKFVTIAGILNTTSQLPLPSQINNLSLAYLVGTSEPYNLWIQIGDEVETAAWEPMGPFNVATAVTVDGQYRSTWNADTKLDKIVPDGNFGYVYAQTATGKETKIKYQTSLGINSSTIPIYRTRIEYPTWGTTAYTPTLISGMPENDYEVTPKKYVVDGLSGKVDKTTEKQRLYGTNAVGEPFNWQFGSEQTPYTIMYRNGLGTASISTPIKPSDIANKEYVDAHTQKVYRHIFIIESNNGIWGPMTFEVLSTKSTPLDWEDLRGRTTFGIDKPSGITNGSIDILVFDSTSNEATAYSRRFSDATISVYTFNDTEWPYITDTVTEL